MCRSDSHQAAYAGIAEMAQSRMNTGGNADAKKQI
jgi:hypothetical protein